MARAKRIQVTVTKRDIVEGIPSDGESCPIALALGRHANLSVFVGDPKAHDDDISSPLERYIRVDDNYFRHTLSSARFVKRFDAGKKVRPTTFRFTEVR